MGLTTKFASVGGFDPANPGPIGATPSTVKATEVNILQPSQSEYVNPALNVATEWNDAADTFHAASIEVEDVASASGSTVLRILKDGALLFAIEKDGSLVGYAADGVTPNFRLVPQFQGGGVFLNGNNVQVVSDAGSNLRIQCATLRIDALPTSSAGLATGTLWNDSGTVKVV